MAAEVGIRDIYMAKLAYLKPPATGSSSRAGPQHKRRLAVQASEGLRLPRAPHASARVPPGTAQAAAGLGLLRSGGVVSSAPRLLGRAGKGLLQSAWFLLSATDSSGPGLENGDPDTPALEERLALAGAAPLAGDDPRAAGDLQALSLAEPR